MSNNNKKYKVTNWREYNTSLKQQGSLTIWLSEDFHKSWLAIKEGKQKTRSSFPLFRYQHEPYVDAKASL